MLYKTHVAVTYAAALPMLLSTNSLTVGNVIAVGIGSIFPDIDHPGSFIGQRTRGVSDGIRMVFGHRGLAHSLVGAAFFLFVSQFVLAALGLPSIWSEWFLVGYLLHMVEDSFSKTGVGWLQPLYNKRIQFGFKKIYYSTGEWSETLIFLIACGSIAYQILQMYP